MTLEEKWKWFEENNPTLLRRGDYLRNEHCNVFLIGDMDMFIDMEMQTCGLGFKGFDIVVSETEDLEVKEVYKITFEECFTNWKSPTEREQQIFNMMYGFRLPWNEEHPLRFPEDD